MILSPNIHARGRQGMAVIVVIALVAIILVFLAGNARSLYYLTRDLRLIERKQQHRLVTHPITTNAPPAVSPAAQNSTPNSLPSPDPDR